MDRIPVFVGIDYHPSVLQVCVKDTAGRDLGRARLSDDPAALFDLVERLGDVKRVAVEACSGAANLADELIRRFGWSVELAHPGYVNRMKQTPDKSDLTDAQVLADLTRVGYLPRVWIPPLEIRELRTLVRHRQGLARDRRNVKLRLRALLREQRIKEPHKAWTMPWRHWVSTTAELSPQARWVIDDLLEQLSALTRRILAAENHLTQVTAHDQVVQCLLQERGVGKVTAWTLRAEIGRFDRFASGKQLSRFCGVSPRNASSGQRQADAGLIKAGNPELRAVLVETAHRLGRYDQRWRELKMRLRAAGKSGSEAAAAIANRWTRGLYHRMKIAA
jgi:transposase